MAKAELAFLVGVPNPFVFSLFAFCIVRQMNSDSNYHVRDRRLTRSSSMVSGSGASLLGTGVNARLTEVEKFGRAEFAFLGLERSGRLTGLVPVGVFEKKDAMDFWFELELDFLRVAGVGADGVADFFAIFVQSAGN